MRAIGWIIISFGIYTIFPDLAEQAAVYNRDMQAPVFGIGMTLFVFIWSLVLSQAIFTRINRMAGYLLLNVGISLTISLALATSGLFLNVLIAEIRNQTPSRVVIVGGMLIAVLWLLWSIVMLVSKRHTRTFPWRILENHKIVGADPAYGQAQSPASDTSDS